MSNDDVQLLKNLIKKRGSVKFRITHVKKYLDRIESDLSVLSELDKAELRQKSSRMPQLFDEFASIQCEIETLSDSSDQFEERIEFENSYDLCMARINCILTNDGFDNDSKRSDKSGVSLVSNNTKQSCTSKFSSYNYSNAYKALNERYNNEKVLIHHHIQGIFNMEKINKETSTDVRKLIDTLSKHLRAIVQLGQKIENWDALIIFIITSKLPKFVNQDWEKHNKKIKEPTIEQLREFLIDRADFLQTMESKSHERGTEFAETKNNESHSISNCSAFSKLNVNERISKAKYLRLCLNCLKPGHFNYVCRANTCKKCNSKHHVLLHIDKTKTQLATPQAPASIPEEPRNSNATDFETPATNGESAGGSVALSAYSSTNFVLLSTASVVVMGERGKKSIVRAVLDSGSQSSYLVADKLWLEKIDWDSAVSKQLEIEWIKLRDNLVELNKLKICRNVICNDALKVELHGFCDASAEAYGAAVYVRSIDTEGKIHVCLLSAKSKVAPLKTISIPRLELCGALILAKLIEKVTDSVKVEFENVYCWTDSTVVLGWLKTTPNLLKTFIANRVSEIQTLESQKQCQWRHVPTKMNPADILSRGMYPKELLTAHMWWNGPVFLLKHESDWPEIKQYGCPLPEIRDKSKMLLSVASESFPIEKFSSLTKLKHVVAYLFRFVKNASVSSENKLTGSLTLEEVDNAFLSLIKCAQKECFAQEICDLESKRKINKKSKLLMLNPFLDKNNVLRVGGRLKNSAYSYDKRHPMILSPKHHLSKLIFEREHLKLYHAGPQALLAAIRERFWVISGKSLAKYVIKKCITCYRYNAKILNPIMGNLPKARFDGHYPFEVTGVDYAGPLLVKDKKGRGAKLQKCYVCLFICFSTKAVHIELVTDLSTESFILTLRRFVSRRGRPRQIWSDNGGNFVGANSELKELGHFLSKNKKSLCESLVNEEIHWQFIPAHSPHFGGLWEAGIKSVKYHLKRVIGEQHLIFEELYTLLVQIESVLNSRPISPLSTNPNDLFPLTPAHFLLGRTASEIPDPDVLHIKPSKLSQFQRIQSIKQQFWKRWSLEYVSELQLRKRWTVNDNRKLEPGILVLIKQDNLPPMKWKLGRVLSVSSDVDGVPRVARLKTDSGEIQRAFSKLCPLPIDD
nr:unnamed protein product [Callosobruchus analis]